MKLRRRRTIFFGNDHFSVAHLKTLHELLMAETDHLSSLCVTTTSRRSPVFQYAAANGLRTHLWSDLEPSHVAEYDFGVLASFGPLLPVWLLNELLVINVHPSLLPRWRGGAPILHSILRGDRLSGVSLMLLQPHHFDTGPLLMQEVVPVPDGVRAGEFSTQLAHVGQHMLIRALTNLSRVMVRQTPQSTEGVTVARRFKSEDAAVDWEALSADQIDRLARSVGDIWPLTSRFAGHAVGLRDFLRPQELLELRQTLALPDEVSPGSPFFDKRFPEAVFVRCKEWTGFRSIRIGRSDTTQRWLTALEFNNGYLAKPRCRGVVFESSPNLLFRKKEPEILRRQPAVE